MTPAARQRPLGLAAAVLVPAAVCNLLSAEGSGPPPFVWPHLFLAHLALTLPLGLAAGAWVAARPGYRAVSPITWGVAGIFVAGFAAWVGPVVSDFAVSEGAGFSAMLLLRASLALALVLPWCVLAAPPASGGWPVAAAAVGLAVVPCALYADGLAEARTEQAREQVERERLVRARRNLLALRELGSGRPVGKDAPGVLLGKLDKQIERYDREAARPGVAGVNRALVLVPLDRLAEAAALLEPLAGRGDLEALLLATVYQEQERWPESDALFARVLDGSGRPESKGAAMDGLVFNAREARRPADVEALLLRGLTLFPDRAAEWHFKLGQHFAHAGRPNRAVEEFRAAAAADPKRYGESARTRIDQLRTGTPACLLGPPADSR